MTPAEMAREVDGMQLCFLPLVAMLSNLNRRVRGLTAECERQMMEVNVLLAKLGEKCGCNVTVF